MVHYEPPANIYRRHQDEGIFKKLPLQLESTNKEEREDNPLHEVLEHNLHMCEALKPTILELMKEGNFSNTEPLRPKQEMKLTKNPQ